MVKGLYSAQICKERLSTTTINSMYSQTVLHVYGQIGKLRSGKISRQDDTMGFVRTEEVAPPDQRRV